MKHYSSLYNWQLAQFDSISKFNITNFNQLLNLKTLNIIIPINTGESNFLKNYIIIIKVFQELFNRKPSIFSVKKNFQKGGKSRNNLIFNIGLTLRNEEIFYNIDYLTNIIKPLTKKLNNTILFNRKFKDVFIIKFFSLNHMLGITDNSYYNISLEFNYNLKFFSISSSIKFNKFYEKFFF
jgi:hypothetical protein